MEDTSELIIQPGINFRLENYEVYVHNFLWSNRDIYYFQVSCFQDQNLVSLDPIDKDILSLSNCLLRVGSATGQLAQELNLRHALGSFKLVGPLIAQTQQIISVSSKPLHTLENQLEVYPIPVDQGHLTRALDNLETSFESSIEVETPEEEQPPLDYLEEEFLDSAEISQQRHTECLLLLTPLPDKIESLSTWLARQNDLETILTVTCQLCHLFKYIRQKGWGMININPDLVLIRPHYPCQIIDLTDVYPLKTQIPHGLVADYCAPELAFLSHPINEKMSTFTVASILYESLHKQRVAIDEISSSIEIKPIPGLYQILKISLLSSPEDRFGLDQFLNLLLKLRQSLRDPVIQWDYAAQTTVGLSTGRFQNEDNYGVRLQTLSGMKTVMMGLLADGMGGMAQGERASQLAVSTFINAAIPSDFDTVEGRRCWLQELANQANQRIHQEIGDGGTTLSCVMALGSELMIAHLGDSRIFLLRNGCICQLSEDHSMVAMLLANGDIGYEDSLTHPDRNILLRSLGSPGLLREDYLQTLDRFGTETLSLCHGDIIFLCSDGLWDLVSANQLAMLFHQHQDLTEGVNVALELALQAGAHDNTTLLALRCQITNLSTV
jgi:PPM family protein phosphatase